MLELANLSVSLGNKRILDRLSIKIENGLNLLVGPTGSGKTTLARTIVGIIPHYIKGEVEGQIILDGTDITGLSPYDRAGLIGYVAQNPELFVTSVSVREELEFPSSNLGLDPKIIRERITKITKALNISDLLPKTTLELSSGQLQLIGIASIMVTRPRVLILDEPTARLDPENAELIAKIIKNLAKERIVLVLEHHLDYFYFLADRVIIMDKGRITGYGRPDELKNKIRNIDQPWIYELISCY